MPNEFTPAEREALAEAGLAVFEDRIIHGARPPIDDVTLAAVARRCAGPIPSGLVALWRTAFGGRLSYDLAVSFDGQPAAASPRELFWPGSDGYRDLWGWIDHEAELAQQSADEAGGRWSGKLSHLPFGGFEYLERIYVEVAPGPDHGAVLFWMQALPPAWRRPPNEDSVARVANDLPALFRQLVFDKDPFADSDSAGSELVAEIAALGRLGTAGQSAQARLEQLVRSAVRARG